MALPIPPRHVVDPSALTPAEAAFMRELAAGARNLQEVAGRLGIAPRSAQRRSCTICQKLGVANWREAVALLREKDAA